MGYFLPFYPPNSPKNLNLKKLKKNAWRYHHFTLVYQKSWLYAIWFLRYGVWWMSLLFFILVYFLPFYPPPFPFLYSPKNKISKKWKKRLQISSFYTSVPKMDGRMDGKSDTERWVAHLKIRKDLCRHGLYAFA